MSTTSHEQTVELMVPYVGDLENNPYKEYEDLLGLMVPCVIENYDSWSIMSPSSDITSYVGVAKGGDCYVRTGPFMEIIFGGETFIGFPILFMKRSMMGRVWFKKGSDFLRTRILKYEEEQ